MTRHADLAIAAGVLALLSLITLANVLSRYFIDVSLAFTEEYSIALLVIMCMFGASHAVARNRHIRITFLLDKLPARPRRVVELFTLALTIFSFTCLALYGATESYDEYLFEVTTPGLGEPQWLYTLWLPLGAVLGLLRSLGRVAELLWADGEGEG
jgi:TRAP-type C4-dicarboxylate transport system permease small subunit